MTTSVPVDDALIERAREVTGIHEATALVEKALQQFVHREAARRLAELGGSEPDLTIPPRARWNVVDPLGSGK
ncbi:type II toxin-antitoxin system VapB family antitoxin [Rhizobium sp. FKL33]|uniref:type II toxin-antitoxin system VapB family antitoxin n=1 Tax=Rhizobium sp. FKL33 TaxID=2562307 RepID=UPI0010C105E3|nr:type II toxin-antitoxin system VapB family antitoxin [Rhizobium sp. FKL33]